MLTITTHFSSICESSWISEVTHFNFSFEFDFSYNYYKSNRYREVHMKTQVLSQNTTTSCQSLSSHLVGKFICICYLDGKAKILDT